MSKTTEDKWNQWLKSTEGKGAMDVKILRNPDDAQYLENRLWWAFHAGENPLQTKLPTEGEELLKEAVTAKYISVRLRKKIAHYLKSTHA